MLKIKLRSIFWQGDSRSVVRGWPVATRKQVGAELMRLQLGDDPIHWRCMASVGRGVRQIKSRKEADIACYISRNAVNTLWYFMRSRRKRR